MDATRFRTNRILTVGGVTTSDFYGYPATSNRLTSITRDGNPHRSLVLDTAGNTTSDAETGGSTKAFVYDSRGQLKTVTIGASLKGVYIYNYAAQLVSRTLTNTTPSGTVHYIHDLEGNVIAETDGLGNTVREYIWMPSGSGSDSEGKQAISASALPLAVVADVDTTPKLYYVHGDHLNRPIAMMDASKAFVWRAMFLPFGGVHSVTGTASTDSRFPGQWFNLESGLHYNWHRHYDPTTGRYLQPDPLGMPDGPSRYAYAVNSPQMAVDPDGRFVIALPLVAGVSGKFISGVLGAATGAVIAAIILNNDENPTENEGENSCPIPEDGLSGGKNGNSPYGHLKNHPSVGPAKDFTASQKKKILGENQKKNDGEIRDDVDGSKLTRPVRHTKGVRPPENEAHIDHVNPRSKGGSNSFGNAHVRSRKNNLKKSNN